MTTRTEYPHLKAVRTPKGETMYALEVTPVRVRPGEVWITDGRAIVPASHAMVVQAVLVVVLLVFAAAYSHLHGVPTWTCWGVWIGAIGTALSCVYRLVTIAVCVHRAGPPPGTATRNGQGGGGRR